MELGVEQYNKKWDRNLEIIAKRAAASAQKENEARKDLDEAVQKVSAGKKTVLMKELLDNMWYKKKYPDEDISRCIREGFPLAGEMPRSGVFERKHEGDIEYGADVKWLV